MHLFKPLPTLLGGKIALWLAPICGPGNAMNTVAGARDTEVVWRS
jgi:hypothetical protein